MTTNTVPQNTNTINPETQQMDRDLAAIRSREQEVYEVADLDCGMSFEDWQEVYGLDNAPGFAERRGWDY